MLTTMAVIVGAMVGVPATLTASPAAALIPAAYESEVLADSPLSWWPLDEASGTAARDVTGPNQGYVQGGVTPGVDGPFGAGSTAFRFDGGACSGVDVGRDPGSLALQSFTIENWFRTDTTDRGIMFRWRNHGYGYTSGSGGLTIDGYPGGTGGGLAGGAGASDGEWHHGVAQWTGGGWILYLDGVKVGEQAASGNLVYSGSNAVAIGRDANACDGNVPSFRGDIAQVAVYDHALSEDRVKAHYCAGVPAAPGCGAGLTSVAGPDQSVVEGSSVVLDGSASRGPDAVAGSGTATTGLGGRLFATGGPVEVEVRPATAGITSQLWLFEPEAKRHQIATNRDTGRTYQVGSFASGDELVFGIAYGSEQFRMGPADRNPDLIEHANVVEVEPGVYDVGFEDISGGGDRDYDDNVFRFRGAVAAAQPLTYRWDLVSAQGPPIQLSDATSATPSFVAFDDGRYTFRLTVSDGLATATDEVAVTVTNQVPVVTRAQAGPTATDGLAQVTVALSDPGAFDTHVVRVDWGDGTPMEDVPAAVNGSGWGYAYAGHVYATTGDKTVTVTAVDDDGGVSAPASTTFNVGAAGQGEPAPGAALWASSQSAADAIRISGSGNEVTGLTHSNGGIRVSGSNHRFVGATEYRTSVSVSGSGAVFDPAARQVPVAPAPYSFAVADYQPGGRAAVAAGTRYTAIASSACKGGKWKPTKPIATGLLYVPCAVQISGSDVAGEVTIVATGDIAVSGSSASFTPFIDGLLFLSTSTGSRAIDLSGSGHVFHGALYADAGGIELTGSGSTLDCGIVAQTARISGSNNSVTGTNCGSGTAGGTPVAVAAPPLLVPNLTDELTVDKTGVFPGETVAYEASVANGSAEAGGANLFLPVQLGADNRGGSPVTVTAATYRLEIHDPTTNTWSTLATTDPAAPADQRIATLTARPNPTSGVTYPAGPDTISGTQVNPGNLGSWAGNVRLALTQDQLALLLDPARVDAVRNTVDIATNGLLVRKIARFSADPLAELRSGPQADISDVHLNLTRPGAVPETVDATTLPALAALTPGQAASVTRTATAGTPDVKATGESDDSYLARLGSLDGTGLYATMYATGNAGVGQLIAPQQLAKATVNVPVVSAVVTAPSAVNAGDPATWTVELTNTGSATATNLDLRLDVAGVGALILDGAPTELAPGAHATVTATTATTAGATTTLIGTATLRWSHPGGPAGQYGPVGGQAQVTSRPPVALAVTKFASTGSATPPGQIQYNLDIANSGTTPLSGVVLDDPIDDNAFIVDGTLTSSAGTIVTGASTADRAVNIEIGDLAVDAHVTVTFRVDYTAATPGTTRIVNQATVTSDQLPPVLSDDSSANGAADPTVTPVSTGGGGGGGGGGGEGKTDPGPTLQGCTPGDTATVTAPTPIACTLAPHPGRTVASWRLSIQPLGAPDSEQHVLATGTGPNVTGTIDPTVLANGLYTVRIVARGSDNGTSRLETTLIVDGNLKLGRYAVTYQDMTVSVGGIPIQVNRSYDSLDKDHVGDFGHGWRLNVANFRAQANRPLGTGGYEQYQCGVAVMVAVFCLRPTATHAVTVTWPDGRTETFDLTPQKSPPAFSFLSPVAYTGRPGTSSKLEPAPGDQYAMYAGDGNLYVPLEANLYNPTRFTLVAKGGTRYLLDTATGLVEARDRNANTLTVDANGVHSSSGPTIAFTRDGEGRITALDGPGGASVSYRYNSAGDLETVEDQASRSTTNTYEDHRLTAVGVPGGTLPWRSLQYGPDGRLEGITDAAGKTTVVTTDSDARTEIVTSADGLQTTVSRYDERGNVLGVTRTHDGVSEDTAFEYDDNDQVIARVDPDLHRWTATYSDQRELTSVTEPDGDSVNMTYDDYGSLLSWTDGENRSTRYHYDDSGLLLSIDLADGTTITYGYDPAGQLTSRDHPVNGVTTWQYDNEGRVTSQQVGAATTTWSYDLMGRPKTETSPDGARSWTYDGVGNVTSESGPDGVQSWTYDGSDRVLTATGPSGTTSYTYDLGRANGSTGPAGTYVWSYDLAGNLVSEQTPDGTVSRTFDGVGRQLTETTSDGTTSWTWDSRDRVESMTRPDGSVATFDWNDDGRIATIEDQSGGNLTYQWNHAGQLTAIDGPMGHLGYGWDSEGHPLRDTDLPAQQNLRAPAAAPSFAPTGPAFSPALQLASPGSVMTPPMSPRLPPTLPDAPVLPPRPRPPEPSEPRRSGGGGVLGEYAMLVQWAVSNAPAVTAVGTVVFEAIQTAATSLTQSTATTTRPPVVDVPETLPDPDPGPDPEDDPRPPPPPPGPECSTRTPDPANYQYGAPGTYAGDPGKPAAQWAIAVLVGPMGGKSRTPDDDLPGWRAQSPVKTDPPLGKGHLIAAQLGGSNTNLGNFVTLFQRYNQSEMRREENFVRDLVDQCEPVILDVKVDYWPGEPDPAELWPERLPVEILHYTVTSNSSVYYVPLRQVP